MYFLVLFSILIPNMQHELRSWPYQHRRLFTKLNEFLKDFTSSASKDLSFNAAAPRTLSKMLVYYLL